MKDKHKFKLFDGSGASIKKTMPNANVAKFEERYEPPQFDDECKVAKVVFNSNQKRFNTERDRSPGPNVYDPKEPKYQVQGPT